MSLLEQDITKNGRVDENVTDLDAGDNDSGEYKVEAIRDSAVYAKKSESSHLPGLYYLVSWKDYPKKENTWEPYSAVQNLQKLISSFHKNHPNKPTTTSETINTASPIVSPIVRPTATATGQPKQKRGQSANSNNKQTKKNWAAFDFYRVFGLFLRCG